MPNFNPVNQRPEEKPLIVPVEEVDGYRAQRAHIAALLTAYKTEGVLDPQLVQMGLVATDE